MGQQQPMGGELECAVILWAGFNTDGLILSICGRPKSWPERFLSSAFSLVLKDTLKPDHLLLPICSGWELAYDTVGTEILQIWKHCHWHSKEHRDYVALSVPNLKKAPLMDSNHLHQWNFKYNLDSFEIKFFLPVHRWKKTQNLSIGRELTHCIHQASILQAWKLRNIAMFWGVSVYHCVQCTTLTCF